MAARDAFNNAPAAPSGQSYHLRYEDCLHDEYSLHSFLTFGNSPLLVPLSESSGGARSTAITTLRKHGVNSGTEICQEHCPLLMDIPAGWTTQSTILIRGLSNWSECSHAMILLIETRCGALLEQSLIP